MKKLYGALAMSVMLMLAACSGGQTPTTQLFSNAYGQGTKTVTFTVPAGVTSLSLLTGTGGQGTPEYDYYVQQYAVHETQYNQRNDLGGVVNTFDRGTTYGSGPTPSNYCTEPDPYLTGGVYSYTWSCYDFSDASYDDTVYATTGPSTTMTGPNGFSKTFPGGYGGPATAVSQSNVTVVAGGVYTLTIPGGGSVSISYYQ